MRRTSLVIADPNHVLGNETDAIGLICNSRRAAVGMLRGEYLSPLSKRGIPTAARRNQRSVQQHIHAQHRPQTSAP